MHLIKSYIRTHDQMLGGRKYQSAKNGLLLAVSVCRQTPRKGNESGMTNHQEWVPLRLGPGSVSRLTPRLEEPTS